MTNTPMMKMMSGCRCLWPRKDTCICIFILPINYPNRITTIILTVIWCVSSLVFLTVSCGCSCFLLHFTSSVLLLLNVETCSQRTHAPNVQISSMYLCTSMHTCARTLTYAHTHTHTCKPHTPTHARTDKHT